MSDPVKILTYLKENSADPDTREALALAIHSISNRETNKKLYELKKEIDALDRKDFKNYMEKLEELCAKYGINPYGLEYLPITLRNLLSKWANGEVYVKGDHTAFLIKNSLLDCPINVCEDDGMGYCTHSTYAFDGYVDSSSNDIKIWT